MGADPKPEQRIFDPSAGYDKLRREQRCRLCGERFYKGMGLSRHHLIPKSQGGDDLEANIIPLCGDGTRGCHGQVEAFPEARWLLRSKLSDEERRYAIRKVGRARFDRRYPMKRPAGRRLRSSE